MTNPPPRPALRKASDSGIHPAVPRGALHAVREPERGTTTASRPAAGNDRGLGADLPAALARSPIPDAGPSKAGGTDIPAWWPSAPAGQSAGKGKPKRGARSKTQPGVAGRGKQANGKGDGKKGGRGKKGGKGAGKASGKAAGAPSGTKAGKKGPLRDPVVVEVSLPAELHARLAARAAEHRLEPEQALVELSRVWLDG